jgi:drug/metabolite transporter (DMT)-like permease
MTPSKLSRPSAVLLALFVVFLWATSWVLIKIGLEDIPPLTFAGLRYVIGFLLLLPVFALSRGPGMLRKLTKRTRLKLLALGLLFYAVTQGASFVALAYLPAVTVNLLWSFSAILVALLGSWFLHERVIPIQWAGILLSIIGAAIYFYPISLPENYIMGLSAAIIGVAANAIAAILGRDINRTGDLDPLMVTMVSMGIGSVALMITGISTQGMPSLSLQSWAIIGWLALVNTAFAFTLWNRTLQTLRATESSVINGTMMIWIPILAILFLGEALDLKGILGLIAAGIGTLLVQMRQSKIMEL